MSYKEAMTELEGILAEISSNQVDIDQLSEKVSRAAELIKMCKTKLKTAENQIQNLLENEN
ncbi:exodeoxyribonuclease VII small subunit [Portibacter lacus]|uniref:Exodeoxyribonuclease VII small subunit n=1 Tax=Portibacter lacus TaxID=1099794 RepID=A0AA37WCD3_9BACT|nr:exodeoxyribonuclease VII small subunit [Portibacter lacus]GLR16361.1 hypothetical protein GCM10007940_09760 [Portibacter lacus]